MTEQMSDDKALAREIIRRGLCPKQDVVEALHIQSQQAKSNNRQPLCSILLALGKITPAQLREIQPQQPDQTTSISGFELLECIEDSQAQTYTAIQKSVDRKVVITFVDKLSPGADEAVTILKAKAKLAGRINHHCISHVIDMGEDDNHIYMATQHHGGCTLEDYINEYGMVADTLLLHITEDFLQALTHLQDKCLVHGNICAKNIIINQNYEITLTDFGYLCESGKAYQQELEPHYRHRFCRSNNASNKLDLYALGMTLFYAATGFDPVDFAEHNVLPLPAKFNPKINHNFSAIIVHLCSCLDSGYQSLAQLNQDLLLVAQDQPPQYAPLPPKILRQKLQLTPWPAGNRACLLLTLLALVGGLLSGLYFLHINKDETHLPELSHWSEASPAEARGARRDLKIWLEARRYIAGKDYSKARKALRELVSKYTNSAYGDYAKELLKSLPHSDAPGK